MYFKPKIILVRAGRKMMVKHYCNHCKNEHFINWLKFSDKWNVLCDNCIDMVDSINRNEVVDFPQWYEIVWKETILSDPMWKREYIPKRLREEIIEHYWWVCQYCWEDCNLKWWVELDHVIPWSFWWSNERWNLVTSCWECNRKWSDFFFPTFYDKYEYINWFYK